MKPITLDSSTIQSRLALCAAALAGTAAAVPTAEATVVTNNTPFVVPATLSGIYLNFLTGVAGASAAGTPGWDFNPYLQSASSNLGFYWSQTPAASSGGVATSAANGSYLNLAPGTTVSGASVFSQAITLTAGNPFLSAGTHILGFRFFNEATSAINYGYLTMTNGGANGFPATITSYSYENNGGAITVVPEPSTTALLALTALVLGAVGVRQWRRQQAA